MDDTIVIQLVERGPRGPTGPPGNNGVTSFKGRVGAVVPAPGDYSAADLTSGTLPDARLSGNVPLLVGGLLPTAYLPNLAITDVFVVGSQAAMLALVAQKGDIAVRTDTNQSFVLSTNSPGTLADWILLRTPTDAVTSVNGQTGAVVLTYADVGAAAPVHTHGSGQITDFAAAVADHISGDNLFEIWNQGDPGIARQSVGLSTTWDTFALPAGNTNDWEPATSTGGRYVRVTTAAGAATLTGLTTSPASLNAGEAVVVNAGPNPLTFAHQNAGSAAARRFIVDGGADLTLAAGQAVVTYRTTGDDRWRVFKLGGGGGGTPGGSSGQLQFNSAGAFGGAAATVYATTGVHLTITPQAAGVVALRLVARSDQTAALAEGVTRTSALTHYQLDAECRMGVGRAALTGAQLSISAGNNRQGFVVTNGDSAGLQTWFGFTTGNGPLGTGNDEYVNFYKDANGWVWNSSKGGTGTVRAVRWTIDGTERLRMNTTGVGFFGAAPVAQQTGGAATAGGTYGATEQTMLQRVYDALRNLGLIS